MAHNQNLVSRPAEAITTTKPQKITSKFLAAKILLAFILFGPNPVHASGIPVFDGSVFPQSVISAMENVTQTIKEIESLALQVQQYEDMLKNSVAPAMYIWSKAQATMNRIDELQAKVDYYMNGAGGIDAYLQKFMTPNQYSNTPYFQEQRGLSFEKQREYEAKKREAYEQGIESQIAISNDMIESLEDQTNAVSEDYRTLANIQSETGLAQGRMEALQHSNELAALMNQQLLQLRATMIAQQNLWTAQAQTVVNNEAKKTAAEKAFLAKPPVAGKLKLQGF